MTDIAAQAPLPRPTDSSLPRAPGWLRAALRPAAHKRNSALPKERVESKPLKLPGVPATSRLVECVDAYARPFAMLQVKPLVECTLVFETQPITGESALPWESWIRDVTGSAMPPEVRSASVTLESSRVDRVPTLEGRVALTLASRGSKGRGSLNALERRAAQYLPRLSQVLSASGDRTLRPVDSYRLSEMIRLAYDPMSEILLREARVREQLLDMEWGEVGPSVSRTVWDRLDHEGAKSCSWYSDEVGRELRDEVSGWLTGPSVPGLLRKRATAVFDLRSAPEKGTGEGAASPHERSRGMIITATGQSQDVIHTIEEFVPRSRLRLRLDYGAQDTTFAMGLPLGQAFLPIT